MGSRPQPNKILQDINDWISELKKESLDRKSPLNDDSVTLHRFQEKLEWILLFGLLEKPAILSSKKTYWNFFCACYNSSKRSHDGINFVKSVVPLKSSLGRGRAFIRFCLMQKCLADTLQSCFMNKKISREFYSERSIVVQEKFWSALVTSLYELNELNFDLSPALPELDISWPKYARKLFISSENLVENKSFSYDNMNSDEDDMIKYSVPGSLSAVDMCISSKNSTMDNLDAFQLVQLNEELSQHNKCLQVEVKTLEEDKLRLATDILKLEKDYQSLQEKMCSLCKSNSSQIKVSQVNSGGESLPCTSFIDVEEKDHIYKSVSKSDDESSADCNSIYPKDPSSANILSVKPKIKEDTVGNYSECAFPLSDAESNVVQSSNSFDLSNKSIDNLHDIDHLQNYMYISNLFLEFKMVINDVEDIAQKSEVTLASHHILRLRKISTCIEESYSCLFHKSKSFLNFNNVIDNSISCIKSFAIKQENIINSLQEKVDLSIKHNQNLYTRISTLKDLLRSYGFLKITNEKDADDKIILLPFDVNSVLPSKCEKFSCDNIAHDPILKRIFVPLMPALNSTFLKLNNLNEKMAELQFGLDSSQELNNHLITRVKDQELHLKGVTKELEEAQHLVSVLKTQHKKLQSAEGILKYDLQEKRKLLNRLKQQLENTREDFNLVRIKNSKSEAEWQDLRNEFMQRHKQSSEESGFVDDRSFEECESTASNSCCDTSLSEEGATHNGSISNNMVESVCEVVPIKKSRLELLEEQCQSLYSSLLQGSKRRQDIDRRLETMCKKIEKSSNGIMHSTTVSKELSKENSPVNISNTSANTEDFCQNIISSENDTNSPHSTSGVGSLNSECSSCIPGSCNDTNSSDSCSYDSSKTDSCISISPYKLHMGAIQSLSVNEQNDEINSLPDADLLSAYNCECKADEIMVSSSDSMELPASNIQCTQFEDESLSQVDSLLIKKKDLEESLKKLEINAELSSDKKRYIDSEEIDKQISELEEERRTLLIKVQELEKKNMEINTELENATQKLILSKAAKEHEVAALQFQLNTEALKYERALKEFREQGKGLENMKERVTDQEELIQALEEALTEIRLDRENYKEQQWQESISEVETEKNKNKILLCHIEELKSCSQKDKESMKIELIHLQNDSRDLKKKLVKLLKEKDLLWKRSNHLYHIQKVKIDDRWMKDNEASSCLTCKNKFTFMLRKHHCRICGRIFCYSCSNNWLLTASSRKKIRSCNDCFMQYMEMKNVVRRGSDVPQVEDDSGDEHNGELPFIPASNCSINSDIPSSITDSVISLLITPKHGTPRFASAPDLRYVIRPEDISSCTVENVLEKTDEKFVINNENCEDFKLDEEEISSEECTSTVEENIPRTNQLKQISINDIENGLSNEFIIPAGERVDLPVICQTCPIVLNWCFTSSCQSIPIEITHTAETCDSETTIYKNKHNMQDEMELSFPGRYVFQFDNSFRDIEVEINYNLSLKQVTEGRVIETS